MKRTLEIEKFRNIGLEEKQSLVLNNSIQRGQIGNLVILVGENNSGKSNVLDALSAFTRGSFFERDFTELDYEEKYQNPKLSLVVKGADSDEFYKYKINGKGGVFAEYPGSADKNSASVLRDNCIEAINALNEELSVCNVRNEWNSVLSDLMNKLKNNPAPEAVKSLFDKLVATTKDIFARATTNWGHRPQVKANMLEKHSGNMVVDCALGKFSENETVKLSTLFYDKYNIRFTPKVLRYEEKAITTSMFNVSHSQISSSAFFKELFKAINISPDTVVAIYGQFSKSNNKGVLVNLESDLNKKLKSVAEKFNNLFMSGDGYEFKFSLESEKLFFAIFKNGRTINIDRQSTGFKWFFNLFFNLLCSADLAAGDIIILDEPATHLHVLGQSELRCELKKFAIKNDLTIVIATHSPFLIDMDYLDELRFVSLDGNSAVIYNDFTAVDPKNPDTLDPVRKALTVGNHVLCSPENIVVFVEGITDYNYLVAMKKRLKFDGIYFLPVQGLGDCKEKMLEVSKRLIQIRKCDPILLVDGDGAGKEMKEINTDSALNVFSLSDVDEKFMTIETLFSKEDLTKYGIVDVNGEFVKSGSASAILKTVELEANPPTKLTENNFKKLFSYMVEIAS